VAFQQQLTVMQGQLDAMEADQRPWMKIEKLEPYKSPIDPWGLKFAGSDVVGFLHLNFLLKKCRAFTGIRHSRWRRTILRVRRTKV